MTAGELVKQARIKKGLTQSELATMLNTTKAAISRYENGKRRISIDQMVDLSKLLDLDFFTILHSDVHSSFTEDEKRKYNEDVEEVEKDIRRAKELNATLFPLHSRINAAMDKLNDAGQNEAVKRVEELTEIPRYQKEKSPADGE